MVAHARSNLPNECCGAMIGAIDGDGEDRDAWPCRWRTPTQARRAPATSCGRKICCEPTREARQRGLDLIGIFHSHPGLRRVLLENGSREFLSLVFVRRAIDQGRQVRPRQQLSARSGPDDSGERRTDMAKVLIPTPLRQYADKKDSVELSGSTVGEVLAALTSQYPDLRKQLFNDEGKLRSFVNVYLNDEDIRYLDKDATPVKDERHVVDRAEHRRRSVWRLQLLPRHRRYRRTRSCATAGT